MLYIFFFFFNSLNTPNAAHGNELMWMLAEAERYNKFIYKIQKLETNTVQLFAILYTVIHQKIHCLG